MGQSKHAYALANTYDRTATAHRVLGVVFVVDKPQGKLARLPDGTHTHTHTHTQGEREGDRERERVRERERERERERWQRRISVEGWRAHAHRWWGYFATAHGDTPCTVMYLFSFEVGPKLGHDGGGVVGV